MYLVPASMKLLGDLNWYLPGWLQWLPQLNVEGRAGDVQVVEHPAPDADESVSVIREMVSV